MNNAAEAEFQQQPATQVFAIRSGENVDEALREINDILGPVPSRELSMGDEENDEPGDEGKKFSNSSGVCGGSGDGYLVAPQPLHFVDKSSVVARESGTEPEADRALAPRGTLCCARELKAHGIELELAEPIAKELLSTKRLAKSARAIEKQLSGCFMNGRLVIPKCFKYPSRLDIVRKQSGLSDDVYDDVAECLDAPDKDLSALALNCHTLFFKVQEIESRHLEELAAILARLRFTILQFRLASTSAKLSTLIEDQTARLSSVFRVSAEDTSRIKTFLTEKQAALLGKNAARKLSAKESIVSFVRGGAEAATPQAPQSALERALEQGPSPARSVPVQSVPGANKKRRRRRSRSRGRRQRNSHEPMARGVQDNAAVDVSVGVTLSSPLSPRSPSPTPLPTLLSAKKKTRKIHKVSTTTSERTSRVCRKKRHGTIKCSKVQPRNSSKVKHRMEPERMHPNCNHTHKRKRPPSTVATILEDDTRSERQRQKRRRDTAVLLGKDSEWADPDSTRTKKQKLLSTVPTLEDDKRSKPQKQKRRKPHEKKRRCDISMIKRNRKFPEWVDSGDVRCIRRKRATIPTMNDTRHQTMMDGGEGLQKCGNE